MFAITMTMITVLNHDSGFAAKFSCQPEPEDLGAKQCISI